MHFDLSKALDRPPGYIRAAPTRSGHVFRACEPATYMAAGTRILIAQELSFMRADRWLQILIMQRPSMSQSFQV